VNLCSFYFYKLKGKLTAFLQLQEFSLRILPVASSKYHRVSFSSHLKSKIGQLSQIFLCDLIRIQEPRRIVSAFCDSSES
jgi:hypothetical protein